MAAMGCLSSKVSPSDANAMSNKRKKSGAGVTPVDKLSDAQLEEFKAAFDMFDADGGGSIDTSELKDLMTSIGQNPTQAELESMIAAADADGGGTIDFFEFATLMAHKMEAQDDMATIRKAFRIFDADWSGHISSQEMMKILINLGERATEEEVKSLIKMVDVDGDGQIDMQEFISVLREEAVPRQEYVEPPKDPDPDELMVDQVARNVANAGRRLSQTMSRKSMSAAPIESGSPVRPSMD